MDPYSRGFRDGAAEATQAVAGRLTDAIEVLQETNEPPAFSRETVIELFQMLVRNNEKLGAQIAAINSKGDTHDDDESEAQEG